MSYVTDDEFRKWIGIQGHVGPDQTPHMDLVIRSASKAIDKHCGRVFGVPSESEQRIFSASGRTLIDDAATVATVETSSDRLTWTATTDYLLDPPNSTPKTTLAGPVASWVRITGTWGYGSTPDEVKLATLMKAAKLWKRKDTPTGVEGFGDFGVVRISSREDADIVALLADLVRYDRVVGIA